jgi:hypothetical protein
MILLESFTDGRGILAEAYNIKNGVTTKNPIIPIERIKLMESSQNPDDRYKFQGIFLVGDKKNANGRIYPFQDVIKPECDRYIREAIGANFGGGELEHPSNLTLNPERFTHKIIKFWYDGCNVIGEAVAGERGMGRVLRDFLDLDFRFGMSSRGIGTVEESYVQNDFELHFVDAVMAPSAPGAYMYKKVAEYVRETKEATMYDIMGFSEQEIQKIKSLIKETKLNESNSETKVMDQFKFFLDCLKK